MKCKNCGHLNKNNTYYCVKCGSSLESSNPIRQYKQSAVDNPLSSKGFSRAQKFIIALVIVGMLIVILSAVAPDLEMPTLATPTNNTQQTPSDINEDVTNKLNTTIKIGSVSANPKEKVTVNAYVTDQNGNPVTGGTTSINLFDVKYSGQVENGNVNIILPELSENNYETTIVYEGNDQYNPSETKVSIEVNKINTKLEANQTGEDEVTVTLKTGNDEAISNAKIIVTKADNTQTAQFTDDNGQTKIKLDQPGKQEINVTYQGDDKYNPTETTITAGKDKIETKLETKYEEQEKTIIVTLTTKDNTPLSDASLKINNNNQESTERTDNDGQVQIPLTAGENNVKIEYDGNNTYQTSETSVNIVIESDDNNTEKNTTNNTSNTTENTTINTTNNTSNKTINDNNTDEGKVDTTFEIDTEDNQVIVTLLTADNKKISGENIKIVFDDGRQLTEKTGTDGNITLNLTDESVKEIELIYEGNDEYNAFNKTLQIRTTY